MVTRSISPEGTATKRFLLAMTIALICIAATLAVYGLLAHYLRPKIRWVKDNVNGDTSLAAYGLEFEPEYMDYDGEDDWQPYGKRIKKTGFTPPCFAFRLLGGIACAVNVGLILWAIASTILLGINATSLANKNLGLVLQQESVQKFVDFAKLALLEAFNIGLVILIAKKGYEKGLVNSLRGIIISVGTIGLMVLCFYLPFSKFASRDSGIWHFLTVFTNRCVDMVDRGFPKFSKPLGKLIAGGCMSLGVIILMVFVNIALSKFCNFVSQTAPTRLVDSVLSCVLYMMIGALVCVVIWFVLAAMDYFGLFHISEVLSEEGAHLSNGLYKFANKLLDTLVAKVGK